MQLVPSDIAQKVREHNLRAYERGASWYDERQPYMDSDFQEIYRKDIDTILAHIGSNNAKILDLGCGTGFISLLFLQRGCSVTAVDASSAMLTKFKKKLNSLSDPDARLRVHLEEQEIDRFLTTRNSELFDIVVFHSILHHLPYYVRSVASGCNLLKPGGVIYIGCEPLDKRDLRWIQLLFARAEEFEEKFFRGPLYRVRYYANRLKAHGLHGSLKKFLLRLPAIGKKTSAEPTIDMNYVEFHATREGVYEDDLIRLLESRGFEILTFEKLFVYRYRWIGKLAQLIRCPNMFKVIAQDRTVS